MAKGEHSTPFRVIFAIVETVAIVSGFALTVFGLMALVGEYTQNFWIRLGIGGMVGIIVPFLLADRFLPEGDRAARVRGLVTDVLAVTWLGFGFLFVVVAAPATGDSVRQEAERLDRRGVPIVGWMVSTFVGSPARAGASGSTSSTTDGSSSPDAGQVEADADTGVEPDGASSPDGGAKSKVEASEEDEEGESEGKMSPAEVFEKRAPAVVSIGIQKRHPLRKKRKMKSGGTGFFVEEDGVIATNHHVIRQADSGEVKLWDGRKTENVTVLDADKDVDLALLKIDYDELEGDMKRELPSGGEKVEPIPLGDSDEVTVGQEAVAIGNPLGLDHTLTDGIVSQRRMYQGKKVIQVSVPLSPGNSGGPLMNLFGEAIGVSRAKLGNAYNRGDALNLAVPVNKLEKMLDSDYPGTYELGEKESTKKGTW